MEQKAREETEHNSKYQTEPNQTKDDSRIIIYVHIISIDNQIQTRIIFLLVDQ